MQVCGEPVDSVKGSDDSVISVNEQNDSIVSVDTKRRFYCTDVFSIGLIVCLYLLGIREALCELVCLLPYSCLDLLL